MQTLYLYHFQFFDQLRGKWITARYVAEREVIAERYAQYEIIREPEVRHVPDDPNALSVARAGDPPQRLPGTLIANFNLHCVIRSEMTSGDTFVACTSSRYDGVWHRPTTED